MNEYFSFYESIIVNQSLEDIATEYVSINYPPLLEFDLKDDSCLEFFSLKSQSAILKVSKGLDKELLIEQTIESKQFKIELTLSIISLYIQKLTELSADIDGLHLLCYDLEQLKQDIVFKYKLNKIEDNSSKAITPKIQWLGDTKVLTTLFYELLNGQDKGKGKASTLPLLKCEKKDLVKLIVENFVDSKGKILNKNTIDEYLNSGRDERAKIGKRIELEY